MRLLQRGDVLSPPESKSMPSIGARCHELVLDDKDHWWRIIYRIDVDAIVIADVFPKKTNETPQSVIDNCKRRLRRYVRFKMKGTVMGQTKRRRLEAKGWKVGSAADFLELSREESVYVELKLRLSDALKQRRKQLGISQTVAAVKLKSSQSRVAKMEANDPGVSLDLLIRSLIELGFSRQGLARIMGFDEPVITVQTTADLGETVLSGRPYTLVNEAENLAKSAGSR